MRLPFLVRLERRLRSQERNQRKRGNFERLSHCLRLKTTLFSLPTLPIALPPHPPKKTREMERGKKGILGSRGKLGGTTVLQKKSERKTQTASMEEPRRHDMQPAIVVSKGMVVSSTCWLSLVITHQSLVMTPQAVISYHLLTMHPRHLKGF